MSGAVTHIPKGFHYLNFVKNQYPKFPSRLPHSPLIKVKPVDRIKRWNIRPGDKVRLMVGKANEKYLDERMKGAGGWKIYDVKSVDLERNKVTLEGLSNKTSVTIRPKPDNFDTMSKEEQEEFTNRSTIFPRSRVIEYSNVQLCVQQNGPDSVFATRVATSAPWFDHVSRTLRWTRYASKLSRPTDVAPDPERGLVIIPWPDDKAPEMPKASFLDSTEPLTSTLHLPPLSNLTESQSLSSIIPSSLRARPPASDDQTLQSLSNAYIADPSNPLADTAMPLYLSEELSPRFSRAKKTRGWNERRQAEAEERLRVGREAVKAWEARGRDKVLMDELDSAGLEGVTIRARTRKEVREAAWAEYDAALLAKKKEVREARKGDLIYDYQEEKWNVMPDGKTAKATLKRERKVRRAQRLEDKLRNLKLEDGKNMVVPLDARA